MATAPLDLVLSRLQGKKKMAGQWVAKCPAHEDKAPSLSVGIGKSGKVIMHCHAGCDLTNILTAVDLTMSDLFTEPPTPQKTKETLRDTYQYFDEQGTLVFQVLRYELSDGGKTFRQRRPNNDGTWNWSISGIERPLYKLPELLKETKKADNTIWIVEGEKDVHTLNKLGLVATTNPGGANIAWATRWTNSLKGAKTIHIVADGDEIGKKHANEILQALTQAGLNAQTWQCPDGYKDISEFLGAGRKLQELIPLQNRDAAPTDQQPPERDFWEEPEPPQKQIVPLKIHDWQHLTTQPLAPEDWVIPNFLERGDRAIIVAPEGVGKLADINTPVPTPFGWTTLGEVRVGDLVFDDLGMPTKVVAVSDIDSSHPCYELVFDDGSMIVAADTHLWRTVDYHGRQEGRWTQTVRTTQEIAETLHARSGHTVNHAIECAEPLEYGHQFLPIDPWLLGYWLGDGAKDNAQISVGKQDAEWFCSKTPGQTYNTKGNSVSIRGLKALLRAEGLLGNKHIPEIYLRASVEQRLELLRGLLDSDGYISPVQSERKRGGGSAIEWCGCASTDENVLADGMMDLLIGLGIKPRRHQSDATLYGRPTSRRTRITFRTALPVFSLPRKAERIVKLKTRRAQTRYITEVRPVPPRPCVCIQVETASSMYLLGKSCIPTHNSMLSRQIAITASNGINWLTNERMRPITTLTVDLENPERLIVRKSKLMFQTAEKMTQTQPKPAHLIMEPQGINLLTTTDQARLEQAIKQTQPDLVLLGPLYKSFIDPGGQTSEAVIGQIVRYLDYLRTTYKFALWLEHHPPLGDSWIGRPLRPFGSAVWSRWPELGLTLIPDPDQTQPGPPQTYKMGTFRGSRDDRQIPQTLTRGTQGLPFTPQ